VTNPFRNAGFKTNNTRPKLKQGYVAGKSQEDFLSQARALQNKEYYQNNFVGERKNWSAVVMKENSTAAPNGLSISKNAGDDMKIVSCRARIPELTAYLPESDAPQIVDLLPSYSTIISANNSSQPAVGDTIEVNIPELITQRYDGGTINFTSPSDIHGLPEFLSPRDSICKDPAEPGVVEQAKAIASSVLEKAKSGFLSLVSSDNPKKNGSSYTTKSSTPGSQPPTTQTSTKPATATNPDPAQASPPAMLKCGTKYNLKSLPQSDTKNTGPNTTTDQDPNGEYPLYPLEKEFPLTSKFGIRVDPVSREFKRMHKGIDIGCPTNTRVLSILPGKVVASRDDTGGGGLYVKIYHPDFGGYYSLYMHCDKLLVKAGQSVNKGTQIAWSGNTGRGTGPHLHFETRLGPSKSQCIDPISFLQTKLLRNK
jgi:murein DD-endopeptidase MepM/ murein hydrolase activator NlpD